MDYYKIYDWLKERKDLLYLALFMIEILLIGIICLHSKTEFEFGFFLFGFIFFLAGLLIGMYIKYFGIIFLFSHGGLGYYLMISLLSRDILSNPILTDGNPKHLILYLCVIAALTVISFGFIILYNISDKWKEKKYAMLFPIGFFTIAFILAGILPNILDKLV